jgi:uncharacterized protein (DUF924 family)
VFCGDAHRDEQLFLYLPFEHQENSDAQARSLELISASGEPELTRYALAHKDIIDRFDRFPHRNAILRRTSTAEDWNYSKIPAAHFERLEFNRLGPLKVIGPDIAKH